MLSVVLATHNEAHNLAACLQSIQDLADEMIVVDGASSDNTVEIARRFKARVIETTNKANFHINKQMAMDAAKGQLILQLDADEVVDRELHAFIQELMAQIQAGKQPPVVAWWLRRRNFFCGRFLRKGGQYPDPVIRLYLRGKARLPMQDVHEQMLVDGPTATATGHLLHYSNPHFADYYRKFQTYTSFKAQQLAKRQVPKNLLQALNYFFYLPSKTFLLLYIRHKGFVDGWQGLVFALFSGLHHAVAYGKYLKDKS